MVNQELLRELIEKYISGDLSVEEGQALTEMLQQEEYGQALDGLLRETFTANTYGRPEDPERTAQFIAALQEKIREQEEQLPFPKQPVTSSRRGIYYLVRIAAAAVLLFVLAGIGYLIFSKKNAPAVLSQAERFKNDIAPGHYGALLTSSGGAQLVLDTVHNGALPGEGNVQLIKKNGELTYTGASRELLYNTISTPKGRQWRLTLSDGTRVWLDAQSSIRYPVSFQGGERVVEITGEAYFDVAKNNAQPFKVKTGRMEIAVLGTQFNVNAYEDEEAKRTTLLQGSVRVSAGSTGMVIKPGQQLAVWEGGKTALKMALKTAVDTEEVTAWKNDQFEFNDAPIDAVLRQLARWYDVDIQYKDPIHQYFIGTISRNEPLSKVLKLLELTGGVQFRIEGKTVTVMK